MLWSVTDVTDAIDAADVTDVTDTTVRCQYGVIAKQYGVDGVTAH